MKTKSLALIAASAVVIAGLGTTFGLTGIVHAQSTTKQAAADSADTTKDAEVPDTQETGTNQSSSTDQNGSSTADGETNDDTTVTPAK